MNKPKTRNENIVIQEMNNEILIYDLKGNKALCLNETSAMIYQLCDGTKTIADISSLMSQKLKTPVDEDLVRLALSEFKRDGLLENDEFEGYFAGFSRREMVKMVGLASMVTLPFVSSVIAPNAVQAASCLGVGILFCSPNPQPNFNSCVTYLQTNLEPICCPGLLRGALDFNPADGRCCSDCNFSN